LARIVDDRGRTVFIGNNFGVGFDANVVIRTKEITRLHGFPKYFWGVLKTLALDFRSFELNMRFDDEEVDEEILFIAFGLGKRHGGGFMLTPEALNDDDLADSCTVRTMSRLKALIFLNSAVQGTHVNNPFVTMRQSKHIEINSNQPLPIHADGEVFAHPRDNVRSLTITSWPSELELIA
jgi:diacylglycerol kinase family enzyme